MKQSIIIEAPITVVFDSISKAEHREKWFMNVTSIRYTNPNDDTKSGATFQLMAEEGKEKVTLLGKNKEVHSPTVFAFELESQTYFMNFTYRLHAQGGHTLVEQEFETKYHKAFANLVEKFFKSSSKQTGDYILSGLKDYCEKG